MERFIAYKMIGMFKRITPSLKFSSGLCKTYLSKISNFQKQLKPSPLPRKKLNLCLRDASAMLHVTTSVKNVTPTTNPPPGGVFEIYPITLNHYLLNFQRYSIRPFFIIIHLLLSSSINVTTSAYASSKLTNCDKFVESLMGSLLDMQTILSDSKL